MESQLARVTKLLKIADPDGWLKPGTAAAERAKAAAVAAAAGAEARVKAAAAKAAAAAAKKQKEEEVSGCLLCLATACRICVLVRCFVCPTQSRGPWHASHREDVQGGYSCKACLW